MELFNPFDQIVFQSMALINGDMDWTDWPQRENWVNKDYDKIYLVNIYLEDDLAMIRQKKEHSGGVGDVHRYALIPNRSRDWRPQGLWERP